VFKQTISLNPGIGRIVKIAKDRRACGSMANGAKLLRRGAQVFTALDLMIAIHGSLTDFSQMLIKYDK
jgi:hypothetical protein